MVMMAIDKAESNQDSMMMMMASEKVESNQDLLMGILIRLPLGSLYKLMSVSRRWKRIITRSGYFRTKYEARLRQQDRFPLLAFIQTKPYAFIKTEPCFPRSNSDNLPLMNILPVVPNHYGIDNYVVDSIGPKYGSFYCSSNGLVLSGSCGSHNTYYVMNLVTRWCSPPLHVPRPQPYKIPVMALVYEPEHEQVYRVLEAESLRLPRRSLTINIYSSNTRKWTELKLKADLEFSLASIRAPISCNGFLLWMARSPFCLVLLKTKDLNVDEDGEKNVQLIMPPEFGMFLEDIHSNFNYCRSSSSDDLWFGEINDGTKRMRIWVLPLDQQQHTSIVPETEWILMHTIDLGSLINGMVPLLLTTMPYFNKEKHRRHQRNTLLSSTFKLEALINWNGATFPLFRVWNRIVLYELESKSFEIVTYAGRAIASVCWYPYIEPVNLSSYFSNI